MTAGTLGEWVLNYAPLLPVDPLPLAPPQLAPLAAVGWTDEHNKKKARARAQKRRRESKAEEPESESEAEDEDWEADLEPGNFLASWHEYADGSSGLEVSQVLFVFVACD